MTHTMTAIMVAHNEERHVESAISGLLNQSDNDYEVVFVDDGSTDNTMNIVRDLAPKHWKLITNEKKMGSGASRNLAVEAARTEWLLVHDADDISVSNRIGMVREILDQNPDADIVAGQLSYLGSRRAAKGEPSEMASAATGFEARRLLSLGIMPVPHPAAALRRSAVLEVGGYTGHLRAQDLGLFIRMRDRQWVIDPRVHIMYRRPFVMSYGSHLVNSEWRKVVIADELGLDDDFDRSRTAWILSELRRIYRSYKS